MAISHHAMAAPAGMNSVGVGSPQAAEIEPVARAQHMHGERQQHAGNDRTGRISGGWKIGRLGHGPLVR